MDDIEPENITAVTLYSIRDYTGKAYLTTYQMRITQNIPPNGGDGIQPGMGEFISAMLVVSTATGWID
jgi:hypothetical protein